jgi:hypothetical protein
VELGTTANGLFSTGTVNCGGAYVITAGHCTQGESLDGTEWMVRNQDHSVTLSGQMMVRVHPTADLAIICLNGTFNDSYDLYMGTIDSTTEVCFTGRGQSDTTPGSGPPADIASGTFRTGYNVLDRAADVAADELGFDFDLAGGTMSGTSLGTAEGTTFGGDSGMGYLVNVGGTIMLAGVHGGILGSGNLNTDQVVSYGTNVQNYSGWIMLKGIPEPSRLLLALLGALAVHGVRRRPRS